MRNRTMDAMASAANDAAIANPSDTALPAMMALDADPASMARGGAGFSPVESAMNDAPALNLAGAAIDYVENGAAAAIAPAATITDLDSPDFDTGTLTVSFDVNGSDGDRLTILSAGTGTGEISVSGNSVRYQGVEIGTFSGGTDGFTPLTITFNAASTPEAAQALMRAIAYSNATDNPGSATRTIGFVLTDGDGGSTSGSAAATVEPVNDTPINTVPGAVTVGEGRDVAIEGVSIFDPDLNDGPVTVTLTVEHGTISIFEDYIGFQITGNGTSTVTITSLDWAINLTFAELEGIVYKPDAGYSGPDTLTITTNDGGLSGTDPGGAPGNEQDVDTIPITVEPANDAPVITPGAPVGGSEDAIIAIDGLTVSDADVDPATGKLTIRLSVEQGELILRTNVAGGITAGDIVSAGSQGGGTAGGRYIVITATPDQINATLGAANGLSYQGAADFHGAAQVHISAHEGGPDNAIELSSLGSAYFPAPGAMLLADLDGDGFDDLIVGYGEGNGTIEVAGPGFAAFGIDGAPTALAVGDFDGDGVKDIAYTAYAANGMGSIGFVAGGTGDTVTVAEISDAIGMIVGDLNGDGLTDIAALRGNGELAILLRNGVSSFAAPVVAGTAGGTAVSLDSGDFNRDGITDLLVVKQGSVELLYGQGNGSFLPATAVATTPSVITGSTAADFNGDGVLDVVFISSASNGAPGAVNGIHILIGDAAGGFDAPGVIDLGAGVAVQDILAADINGDGITDLVVAAMGSGGGTISVLRGNGDGTFQAGVTIATNANPHLLASGDPDGDGDIDLLAGSLSDLIEAFNNDSDRSGSETTIPVTVAPVNDAPSVANTQLAGVAEDETDPAGESVAALFLGKFTDPDNPAETVNAIAVTDNTADPVTQGSWQYSTDGGTTWLDIGAVATGTALVLNDDAFVRFLPVSGYAGVPPALGARALDDTYAGSMSSGGGRVVIDASGNGGTTAISGVEATIGTSVGSVNDAPLISTGSPTLTYVENGQPQSITPNFVVTDDQADFGGGSLRVAITAGANAADQLTIAEGNGITIDGVTGAISFNGVQIGTVSPASGLVSGSAALEISLLGPATPAAVEALMEQIHFANSGDNPGAATRTVTYTLNDGGPVGGSAFNETSVTRDVDVTPVDDPATAVADFALVNANAAANLALLGNDADPDGGATTIVKINGVAIAVGESITLASGAIVTLLANGTVDYDPNGQFESLVSPEKAAATGAINSTAQDSFTYEIAGGSSATVTVTVRGADGPGDWLVLTPSVPGVGTAEGDQFILSGPGSYRASGMDGDDRFFAGANLDTGDVVNGGDGIDTLILQGNYAATLRPSQVQGIEKIELLSGTVTTYGSGGGTNNYSIVVTNGIVGPGGVMEIDASTLTAAERLTLNAAGVTDGRFIVHGGLANDVISGGSGADQLHGGGGADSLTGGAGNDQLFGGNGNDGLDGGLGVDTMDGGAGDDTFYVDDAGDIVVDAAGGGNDRVFSSASYALQAGAEIELLSVRDAAGTAAINLTGNEFAQAIMGNNGANSLNGGGGNDTLYGRGGDDVLDGGTGNDMMIGGTGNDTYVVDGAGDFVTELAGEGNDRILALASYVLRAGSEVELIAAANQAGTTALNLTGNEFAQAIIGNDGANRLEGGGGNDTLYGLGGNDVLDGGTGGDMMIGGAGDDTYVVDNPNDFVTELAGEGNDRVLASSSFTLRAGSEVELISAANQLSTNVMNLTGNEFAQAIIGNDGANILWAGGGNDTVYGRAGNDTLDGGAGNDMLIGGTGDDTYAVDTVNDYVMENVGEGYDRVLASANYTLRAGTEIELLAAGDQNGTIALTLRGNEFAQSVIGNEGINLLEGGGGNDTLYGLGGNDTLDGGVGNDMLIGGGGADRFQFSAALDANNADRIGDWGAGDQIWLKGSIFGGHAAGALSADAFRLGTAAQDADDRLIYDQASGRLYFDADGNGAGQTVLFAIVTPGSTIGAGDFFFY